MRMSEKQYKRELKRLVKYYDELQKKYIKTQESTGMLTALQRERNERLLNLAKRYHEQK